MAGCSQLASLKSTGLEYDVVGGRRSAHGSRFASVRPSSVPFRFRVGCGAHSAGRRSCQWQRVPIGYSTLPGAPGQPSGESPSGAVGQCGVQVVSDTVTPLLALT